MQTLIYWIGLGGCWRFNGGYGRKFECWFGWYSLSPSIIGVYTDKSGKEGKVLTASQAAEIRKAFPGARLENVS